MAFHDGNDSYSYGCTTSCGGKRGLDAPMPSREELLARNSFGSPDDNKYLKTASQRRLKAAEREAQEARQAEVARKWGVK